MSSRYNSDWDDDQQSYRRPTGPNWGKITGIVLSIVLACVVAGGGLVYYFGHSLIGLTNYVSDSEQRILTDEEMEAQAAVEEAAEAEEAAAAADADNADGDDESVIEYEEETEGETDYHQGVALSDDELAALQESMSQVSVSSDLVDDENVFNIVLTGVDRRDKTWNGNSDSMMLVSINFAKNRVSIISLMRDTYVNIPDVGYAKLNNAYARGGGKLMCETISANYNINVSNYAAVDFEDMIEIIDALGGVELEWTDAEVQVSNGYMVDMCNTLGLNSDEYILPGAGTYLCNGVQAVAYARNRYVGNSDYARTERQRYVMSQMLTKIKEMDVLSLTSFVTKVLPLITHNLDESDIWELVTKAADIFDFDFVTDRVPYDNMYDIIYVNGQDMLVPYWEETIAQMYETIYGDGAISDNSDNNQEDRTIGNDTTNAEFEYDILQGEAQSETPYYGDDDGGEG